MEDRDKIKKEILETKKLLFKTHEELASSQKEAYNLEEEFKKTRKNKNSIYYIVLILFIGVIISITVLLTKYINKNTQHIDLKDEEFQDLVLKDIVNSADETENLIKISQNELDDIITARNNEIDRVRFDTKKQIDLTKEKKGMFKEQKNKIIKELTDNQNIKINNIYKRYSPSIKAKEKEIKDLKTKSDNIKKQINSQQNINTIIDDKRIQELKMNKIFQYYDNKIKNLKTDSSSKSKEIEGYYLELLNLTQQKYDPVFSNDEMKNIDNIEIDNNINIEINIDSIFLKYNDFILNQQLLTEQKMKDLVNHEKNRETIKELFSKIPYDNSMVSVLNYMNYNEKDTFNEYNNLIDKLLKNNKNQIEELNKQKSAINELENFIYTASQNSVKTDKKLIGYVITINNDQINGYIFKSLNPKNNQKAYIIRGNNTIIANLNFNNSDSHLKIDIINKTANIINNDYIYMD